MEIGLFDEVKVVCISDEGCRYCSTSGPQTPVQSNILETEVTTATRVAQLAELEFSEAQEEFCSAACRWYDTKQQDAMEKMTEAEVRLLNVFTAGSDKPIMLRAWAAYRRRLLFRHRRES